jgi:hypothetical protein
MKTAMARIFLSRVLRAGSDVQAQCLFLPY